MDHTWGNTRNCQIGIGNQQDRTLPVVKDLASHNVPTDTPAILITLLPEPVVPKQLLIKIVCLVR
jgi:hypothetical protein